MSRFAQAKILRAIETKEVQRLGSTRNYNTDVRILAATHHNLDELASAETFRRDLYFRLNVGRIHLPPLRERKADIAGLVDRMERELNRKLGRRIEGITKEAIRALVQYDWPGNVRELKNVMEKVFIARESGPIVAEDLPSVLPLVPPRIPSASDTELRGLQEALATCNGNKSKAAEKLNWSRMTLYRKLAKYKLGT
jgi:transcriptional regulator with PAS, ATPase and Fis domain